MRVPESCRRAAATVLVTAAAAGLLAVAGCGSTAALHEKPQTAYPETDYLVAVGTSQQNMADAESRARQAVAAQIRSTIASQTESEISDDGESYSASYRQVTRQDAAFSHAELIRIDLDSRRVQDGQHHVVAYLPRAEAGRVLRADYDAAAVELDRHAAVALDVPRGDLPGFAAAYATAAGNWTVLYQRHRELRAVTGRPPISYQRSRERWDEVEHRRLEHLDGVRVAFNLLEVRPAGDHLDDAYLRQEFANALTGLGLTLRGNACGAGDYLVELQPRLHYQGVIGVVCRLDFAGRLVECDTGDAWDLHLQDETFVGEGANTYTARKGAETAVTAESLAPLLADALDESLPVR